MKILYVEDEIAHVILAQRTLEDSLHQPFRLIHAETIGEALRVLTAEPDIDLVLSDLRLPDGTGLNLLKKIRERKKAPAVVLVTGQGDQEVAVAALKAGAADYLVKQSDYLLRLPVVLSNAIAQNRLDIEQEALRQAEVKYQSLVEHIAAVVFLEEIDGGSPLYISPRIEELTGYTTEEWCATPDIWKSLLHPDDKERILAADVYSIKTGTRFLEDYRLIRRDGSTVWVKEDTNIIHDKQGIPLYWQGVLLDITKEEEALELIRKSEERFRRIFHASPIATCVVRAKDGKFIDANQSYLKLVDRSFEELVQQAVIEIGLWKDEAEQSIFVEHLSKNGAIQGIEYRFPDMPGGPRDTLAYYELIELGGQTCILAMYYDVTEEKKAQKALQAERDFALQVLNNMGQGLTVTTKKGTFEYVNPAYASMLGYTPEEILGKTLDNFTSDARSRNLEDKKGYYMHGASSTYELTLLNRDSHEVPALITEVPRQGDGKVTGTIAVITDLTDRKKTEDALARQVKELTILHSVAIAESESQSEDEIIEKVTIIIRQIYDELCGFLLLSEKDESLTPHASYAGADLPQWQDSFPITTGITGRAVSLEEIIRSGDVSKETDYIAVAAGIQAELSIPIRVNGRIIGVLDVESRRPNAFDENDERFLNTIANSVGTALERLRFFNEEQRRSRELSALYHATKSLAQSLKPEVIAENLLATMDELLGYEIAALYILDTDGHQLIPLAISPKTEIILGITEKSNHSFLQERREVGQGILGWVAQHGQPICTGDVDNEVRYQPDLTGIKSELCVPLIARGRVTGVLDIESTVPNAYGKNDESLLTALANSAAIALENAHLYQDALQSAERRSVLHRISQDIVRFGQDVEQIYVAIHEAAEKLMSCDAFVISLRDELTDSNIFVYMFEDGTRYEPQGAPANIGLVAAVISEGKSISLRDEGEIERMGAIHFGSSSHVQSVLAVPMRASNQIIGMISAQSYEAHAYGAEEQALLEMLAAHAATAIENGRLFESEQKRRQEAENLRQAATAISSSLDPDQVLNEILKALQQVIHYDNSGVFLHEGEWLRLAVCQSVPELEKLIGSKLPAHNDLFEHLKISKRPVVIEEIRFNNWGDALHVHGWMAIPLITRGRVTGYITLDHYTSGIYDEALMETAMAFANQAAAALENARLFQEQSRRSRIIEALADIANEIATTRDVQSAMDQITQRTLNLLNAELVAIYLVQDDHDTLRTISAHGTYRSELLSHTRKVGEGVTGNVFLNGKPEIIDDISEDPRKAVVPGTPEKMEKLTSLMSSPLILRGKTIGVINTWRLKDNGLFNEAELNFLVGIAHQVSICIESGRLFQETNRQAQEAAAIAEVGRDISATLDLDIVLERIASYARELLHGETSAVYLADGFSSTMRAIAVLGRDAEAIKNDPLLTGTGILGNIARQNIGEIVNDTANDPRAIIVKDTEKELYEHIMGVPVLLKDKHTGLLAIWRSGIGTEFTTRELDFLTSLARQAAVAIENARLYNETQQRIKELEIINRVSTSMRTAQSMDEMLPILLNDAMALLDTPHGSIWMYEHTSSRLVQKLAYGASAKITQTSLSPVEGIVGRTFTSGTSYVASDIKNDPLLSEIIRESGSPEFKGVFIPIQSTAGPVGVLVIAIKQGGHLSQEINLLSILAEITGNSIHRVQLYEQSQMQVRRLTTLRDIDAAIASSFDLRLTLNILMDQTLNHLKVDAVQIGLYHPDIQSLTYLASAGYQTPSPTRPQIHLGEGLAGQVIVRQSMLHITDLQNAREVRNEPLIRREGFVTYLGIPLIVKGQIKGVFEVFHRTQLSPSLDWMEFLHTLAGQAAIAIDSSQLFENLQRSNQELMQAYDTTLEGWARALELRDRETEGHTRRVTKWTMQLAKFMGVNEKEMVNIHRGVLLHDIGKMGVPDQILKKTGKLTEEEWEEMKQHPIYAYNLLSPIAYLRGALDIPYCHHEHWDGSGYPRGLKGEQIPLSARIFSIIDIWDALRSDRPYRKAWDPEKVDQYIKDCAGTILDPHIVESFFKMMTREQNQMD